MAHTIAAEVVYAAVDARARIGFAMRVDATLARSAATAVAVVFHAESVDACFATGASDRAAHVAAHAVVRVANLLL